ncbi:hypothetical protein Tco_0729795, partial [Tanacetum coccineum]
MAFVSSSNNNTSSSNEAVNAAHGVTTASTQVNTTYSINIDNLSDAVICSFFASRPNSPQLAHEDVLKWSATTATRGDILLGSAKLQEIKTTRKRKSQEGVCRLWKHYSRLWCHVMVLGGYDWSDQAEEGPNYALMAYSSLSSDSEIVDNCKKGLGYEKYNAVPPLYTGNFLPPTPDLSFTGLDGLLIMPVVCVQKSLMKKVPKGNPKMDLQDQGVIDSGCSRHMTRNMSYLTDYEEIDGGYVAFGGNPKGGKITGKCTIKT